MFWKSRTIFFFRKFWNLSTNAQIIKIYTHFHRNQFSVINAIDGKDQAQDEIIVKEMYRNKWKNKVERETSTWRGSSQDGAKGMYEHALWADLEEMVEVKEAVLELPR